MIPMPLALTLNVCDYVLIEETTRNVSLIGCFNGIRAPRFPFVRHPFCVFAAFTGGQGTADVELTVTHLESDEEVYALQREVQFPNRFVEVRILFRLAECEFPTPGAYLFTLLIDGDWAAHRRIHVHPTETNP